MALMVVMMLDLVEIWICSLMVISPEVMVIVVKVIPLRHVIDLIARVAPVLVSRVVPVHLWMQILLEQGLVVAIEVLISMSREHEHQ